MGEGWDGVNVATKKTVDTWMSEVDSKLLEMAEALRRTVLEAVPDLTESIKWGNPVYEKKGNVCYLAATDKYLALGFFNAMSLTDAERLMEGTGKKMRHVKVRTREDIDASRLASWVREAVALNESATK